MSTWSRPPAEAAAAAAAAAWSDACCAATAACWSRNRSWFPKPPPLFSSALKMNI